MVSHFSTMRRIAVGAVLASLCLLMPPWQSAEANDTEISVKNWSGTRHFVADDIEKSFCALYATYVSKITVGVMRFPGDEQYLRFHHPSWNLPIDQAYLVTLSFDNGYRTKAKFYTDTESIGSVLMTANSDLEKSFRYSNVMTLKTAKQTFSFKLTGTSAAITLLERCTAGFYPRHTPTPAPSDSNPFSSERRSSADPQDQPTTNSTTQANTPGQSPQPASSTPLPPEIYAEAERVIRQLELGLNLTHLEFTSLTQNSTIGKWTSDQLNGKLVVKRYAKSPEEEANSQIQALAAECPADFASSKAVHPSPLGEVVETLVYCGAPENKDNAILGYFTQRPKGGVYLFWLTPNDHIPVSGKEPLPGLFFTLQVASHSVP